MADTAELKKIYEAGLELYTEASAGRAKVVKVEVVEESTGKWSSTIAKGVDSNFTLEEAQATYGGTEERWRALGYVQTIGFMDADELAAGQAELQTKLAQLR